MPDSLQTEVRREVPMQVNISGEKEGETEKEREDPDRQVISAGVQLQPQTIQSLIKMNHHILWTGL